MGRRGPKPEDYRQQRSTDFGQAITQARLANQLSQHDLAQLLGVSQSAVAKWEYHGRRPKTETLRRLLICLDLTAEDPPEPFTG